MTIATAIERIDNAKAAIRTSIQNKGVTVPASAKIDTYSSYINQIKGGGVVGLVGSKVLRAGTYTVGNHQMIGGEVMGLSYITGNYMFLPSLFKRWTDSNGVYVISMCLAFTPNGADYIQSSVSDSDSGSLSDRRLAGIKITESGNTITIETSYWRYSNEHMLEYGKYYYRATGTFDKSTNTFGQWTLYVTDRTTEIPDRWFEGLIGDQGYYTVSMEIPKDSVGIEKWTPTFS